MMVVFILFCLIMILVLVYLMCLFSKDDKDITKCYDTFISYETDLEKYRKIVKVQKKMLLKKRINLILIKIFKGSGNVK